MSDGPVVRLRLAQRHQRLLGVGAERDLGDVGVAVGDRLQGEILARHLLAAGGELGGSAERGRLGRLAAGVGVDLGVHHQDVHVAVLRQHVVEPAVTDVVGPAVAADEPDAAANEKVGERAEIDRLGAEVSPFDRVERLVDPFGAARRSSLSVTWRAERIASTSDFADPPVRASSHEIAGDLDLLVDGDAEAEAELGIVLEQRVRPCRARARPAPAFHGVVGRLPP